MPGFSKNSVLSFLALGDSYTIGEDVLPAERWPVQLATALQAQGMAIDNPLIIARTGWTTSELAAGIAAENPQGPFDLVSLLIGVNNQYRGLEIEAYQSELRDLLKQAIGFADERAERTSDVSGHHAVGGVHGGGAGQKGQSGAGPQKGRFYALGRR